MLGVLDVLLDESVVENLLALVRSFPRRRRHSSVQERVVALKDGRLLSSFCESLRTDAEVLFEVVERGSTLLESRLDVAMHPQDVLRDEAVSLLVDVVGHDEEEIESREERVGEGDVLVGILVDVVLSVDGVGGGDNGASGVERGVDTGLCDRDGLLFHDFVDRDSIDL